MNLALGINSLAALTNDGWRPGIGDPGLAGWTIVAAYAVAGALALRAWRRDTRLAAPEMRPRFWLIVAGVMFLLAINKQLDLQSAVTWLGKRLAREQGWYEARRGVQAAFIAGLLVVAAAVLGGLLWWLRRSLRRYALALAGLMYLGAFIIIRAASFHDVDHFLKWGPTSARVNHLLELAGIALVIAGAMIRSTSDRPASDKRRSTRCFDQGRSCSER